MIINEENLDCNFYRDKVYKSKTSGKGMGRTIKVSTPPERKPKNSRSRTIQTINYKTGEVPFGPLSELLAAGKDLHGAIVEVGVMGKDGRLRPKIGTQSETYLLLRDRKSETGYGFYTLKDGNRSHWDVPKFATNLLYAIGLQTNPELKR